MTPVTAVSFPSSAVVHVVATFADGVQGWGSGSMIDPTHVLTAGHCLYSARHGGFATQVRVYANQIGNQTPFGVAYATHERTFGSFIADERATPGRHAPGDGDIGLLTLDRALGNRTGWFGWGYNNNDNFFRGLLMNTRGYPADHGFSGTIMYAQAGYIRGAEAGSRPGFGALHWSTNQMSCIEGQSGSGMYVYAGGHRTIYGVLDVGNDNVGGYAERITPLVYNTFTYWITQDNSAARTGLRIKAAEVVSQATHNPAAGNLSAGHAVKDAEVVGAVSANGAAENSMLTSVVATAVLGDELALLPSLQRDQALLARAGEHVEFAAPVGPVAHNPLAGNATFTCLAAPTALGAELASLPHLQGEQALFVGSAREQGHALAAANDLALQALANDLDHQHELGSLDRGISAKAAAHQRVLDEALFGGQELFPASSF